MKRMSLILFALAGLAVAAPASAQKAAAPAPAAAPAAAAAAPAGGAAAPAGGAAGGVTYKAKTVYDFDDDLVEGDLVRPDGDLVDSRGKAKHSSLIKIRRDFVQEMVKSVESI